MIDAGRTKIAGMLIVRKNSVRVPNKLLRPFGDTTLFDIALAKFRGHPSITRLYLCAHEEAFLDRAAGMDDVTIIRRSERSANGETAADIYDFLDQVEEEWLVNINPCCPFVKRETFANALALFAASDFKSLIPSTTIRDWVCDAEGNYLNADPDCINSKDIRPLYKMSHPFIIYLKERMATERRVWALEKDDPHLINVSDFEGIDIDMPDDFTLAEALYLYLRQKGDLARYL